MPTQNIRNSSNPKYLVTTPRQSKFCQFVLLALLAFSFSAGTAYAEVCPPSTNLTRVYLQTTYPPGGNPSDRTDSLQCHYNQAQGRVSSIFHKGLSVNASNLEIKPVDANAWKIEWSDSNRTGFACDPSVNKCEFNVVAGISEDKLNTQVSGTYIFELFNAHNYCLQSADIIDFRHLKREDYMKMCETLNPYPKNPYIPGS